MRTRLSEGIFRRNTIEKHMYEYIYIYQNIYIYIYQTDESVSVRALLMCGHLSALGLNYCRQHVNPFMTKYLSHPIL